MQLTSSDQVFNLFDTNGRRNDIANAIDIYIRILDSLLKNADWKNLPESTTQLSFYQKAIEASPDVFRKHEAYDQLLQKLNSDQELRAAIDSQNTSWLVTHKNDPSYQNWFIEIDKTAEQRARHYTSNLVKLGFATNERKITAVGRMLIENGSLSRDELEDVFPLDNTNIIYLRQALKLRIYTADGSKYFSPFCMGLYALLSHQRISKDDFRLIVQACSPYNIIKESDIDKYINKIIKTHDVSSTNRKITIPNELDTNSKLSHDVFARYFTNRKSKKVIDVYYEFYNQLFKFRETRSQAKLDHFLLFYKNNKTMLNKAFGFGGAIFKITQSKRIQVSDFLTKNSNSDLLDERSKLNVVLFKRIYFSKIYDDTCEYFDTTMRIFKTTGIIKDENGYIELAYAELCNEIFDKDTIKSFIFGTSPNVSSPILRWESSQFYNNTTISEILQYNKKKKASIFANIIKQNPQIQKSDIHSYFKNIRNTEFKQYIDKNYPEDKIKKILALFANRNSSNDKLIHELVSKDATVPTIYEYIVGIAWYYFSKKSIDLLDSLNLTLSADFEPLVHARGGMPDILINDSSFVILLEATLLDPSGQARNELEPVQRHSINCKIDEEENGSGRTVTTFFVTNTLDANTVNIWRGLANIQLQSSVDRTKYTSGVVIMSLETNELIRLIDEKDRYNQILNTVVSAFKTQNPGPKWRSNLMSTILP